MGKWCEVLTKEYLYQEYVVKRKSSCDIAKEVGFGASTVLGHLWRYGISIRTISKALCGRHPSVETRRKISKSVSKTMLSPEVNRKIRKSAKRRPKVGAETRRKLAKASKRVWANPKLRKEMSEFMRGKRLQEKNPCWSGDRMIRNGGYAYVKNPNGYGRIAEHQLVIEQAIGRKLAKGERPHHINEIKGDNRVINLILFVSESAHKRYHHNLNNVKSEEILFDGRLHKGA